jgi:hypothetical protein
MKYYAFAFFVLPFFGCSSARARVPAFANQVDQQVWESQESSRNNVQFLESVVIETSLNQYKSEITRLAGFMNELQGVKNSVEVFCGWSEIWTREAKMFSNRLKGLADSKTLVDQDRKRLSVLVSNLEEPIARFREVRLPETSREDLCVPSGQKGLPVVLASFAKIETSFSRDWGIYQAPLKQEVYDRPLNE